MFLEKIYRTRREAIALLKKRETIEELQEKIGTYGYSPYSLRKAIQDCTDIGILAEIKRASPSKGVLRETLNAVEVAKVYEIHGAIGISVLTEPDYFQGSYEDLKQVRKVVRLPLLNKDFIFDKWQVYKAKSIGADAILLIATMLEEDLLQALYDLARGLDLDVLLEVHTEEDLKKVASCPDAVIGINNRDLYSFYTTIEVTQRLARKLPSDRLILSESGIHTKEDMMGLKGTGIRGILVGESLIKAEDKGRQFEMLRSGWHV